MHGVTQVLQVKARLLASAKHDEVLAIAALVHEVQDPMGLAALCLAAFDGDASICDYALRKARADNPPWVQATARRRMERGLPCDYPSILLDRMLLVSRTSLCARGATR